MTYIILAKGQHEGFKFNRQLSVINNERLLDRTIRLLKENGVKDILVTGDYTDIDAPIYECQNNTYDYNTGKGYWLDAFPLEILDRPTCYILGDVYFSEEAIKTIVETETESTLFFCSYKNTHKDYIKHHDEPFAFKVVDTELFKEHIRKVKRLYDEGKTIRNPIIWELYRSINDIDVNKHIMTKNYIAINDITCDIDCPIDILKIGFNLGVKQMAKVRLKVREYFTLNEKMFNEITELVRANAQNNEPRSLYVGDMFLCSDKIAGYLLNELDIEGNKGNNPANRPLVETPVEVIPEEVQEETKEQVKQKEENVEKSKEVEGKAEDASVQVEEEQNAKVKENASKKESKPKKAK